MPRSETGNSKQPADEGANALSFEAAMQELESLVQRMEQGDVPLEDGLKAFERGRSLVTRCKGILDGAEKRIQQLGLDQLQAGEGA
ncbi:MAG: exodeoxyribonuclease VII small subunit [Planctomycetes bacterium]|jgi:exodeoxyribonuclease VII small subunit|nr:exodeoxyribonuclease VII small subunit [Planctomycetota bacterium]